MDWWLIGLIALCVVGVAVIGYGALHDRRKRRRAIAQTLNPPAREIPQLPAEAGVPTYLTRSQARHDPADSAPGPSQQKARIAGPATDLSIDDRAKLSRQLADTSTRKVMVGYASHDFVTDSANSRAILDRPRVLVSAEQIMAIRELLGPLEHMIAADSAIVIVAPSMAPDVLETLEVNNIQRRLRVLVVLSMDPLQTDAICSATGARLIGRFDLQSGYLADSDLGRCARWVSDSNISYLVSVDIRSPAERDQP